VGNSSEARANSTGKAVCTGTPQLPTLSVPCRILTHVFYRGNIGNARIEGLERRDFAQAVRDEEATQSRLRETRQLIGAIRSPTENLRC
jgi:hypothetical protein